MSNTVTLQNAPRDYNELLKINRTVRYRLGLSLAMWGNDQAAEEAFLALPDDGQANALMEALQRYDAAGGGNGVQQHQQVAPPPQQQYAPPPQQAPPQQQYPQGPPPQGYGPPPGQQPPQRSPSTTSDPANAGAMHPPQGGYVQHPQGGYMPAGQPAPGYGPPPGQPPPWQGQPPQAPPPQAPPAHPFVAPQNGSAPVASAASAVVEALSKLQKTIDEEVPGMADLEELKDILLGVAKIQQTQAVLLLLIADNALGMQRPQLINLVERELQQGSYNLFAGTQGKG